MRDYSGHRNRTAPTAWTPLSFLHIKDPRRLMAFACILAGVAVGAAAAISTGIYVRSRQEGKRAKPFCCPGLARELAWYINESIDPCADFFSYVCSNVLRDGQRHEDHLDVLLAQSLITGASSNAMPRGDAGRFLTSFYRSCVKTLPYPENFYQSIASALVRDLWEYQESVNTRRAFLYILAGSIKYKLPSAVDVSMSENKSTVVMKSNEICTMSEYYYDVMTAVVDALNERPSATTVSLQLAFGFRDKLCQELLSSRRTIRQYATHKEIRQIQEELWSMDDLDAGFRVYGSSLWSLTILNAVGVHQIKLIHDQFATQKRNSTAAAIKVAFLVWHSVVYATEDFYVSRNFPLQLVFRVCQSKVLLMHEFWETFAAEMLTSLDKDAAVKAVFAAVKRSFYADIRASLLIDADDAERLRTFIKNLVLVTPFEASHISTAVPNATEHFGEDLLRGHAYDFSVGIEREGNLTDVRKTVYQDVQFLGERQVLLSSRIYGYVNGGLSDYELPNNARLGRLLAEAIWYMALVQIKWTSKSRANIKRYKKCFVENYLGKRKTDVSDSFIAIVLGLSSVVKSLNKSDWETLKPAWSLWRISNSQFFFMLSTYYRCPWLWFPKTARLTNVSLLYNEDFATAFQCPFSAPTEKTRQCFVNGTRALKRWFGKRQLW